MTCLWRSNTRRSAAALLLLTSVLSGCEETSGSTVEAVRGSQSGLLFETEEEWESTEITVCWRQSVPNDYRIWLREAIESSWEQVIEVDFKDWGDCTASQPAPPRIDVWVSEATPGATIGDGFQDDDVAELYMALEFDQFDSSCDSDAPMPLTPSGRSYETRREMCFKNIAVHEFGHLLAFQHEQNVLADWDDCESAFVGNASAEHYADHYDPLSVMNYCNPLNSPVPGGGGLWRDEMLSPWDIAGAQEFYGSTTDDYWWFSHGNVDSFPTVPYSDDYLLFDVRKRSIGANKRPVLGDFDGDGDMDIYLHGPGAGSDSLYWSDGDRTITSEGLSNTGNFQPIRGDFNGDGLGDVFLYNLDAGDEKIWWGTASTFTDFEETTTAVSSGYTTTSGDFDGDERTDILWYKPGAGADRIWWGNANKTFTSSADLAVAGTYIPLAGDFDSDDIDDIFWYQAGTGEDPLWKGRTTRSFQVLSNELTSNGTYMPVVGDFDGNTTDDIFWLKPGSGDRVWMFTSGFVRYDVFLPVYDDFEAAFAGDIDGDGRDDIFFYGGE